MESLGEPAFAGTDTKLPGMLFWIALVYAGIGTFLAHMIGRRLIKLNFEQEKYEADFRYQLARTREFNEPIALLRGEPTEKARLVTASGRSRSITWTLLASPNG